MRSSEVRRVRMEEDISIRNDRVDERSTEEYRRKYQRKRLIGDGELNEQVTVRYVYKVFKKIFSFQFLLFSGEKSKFFIFKNNISKKKIIFGKKKYFFLR